MADWKKTNYGVPDTWDKQVQKERDRRFDEKYPTTWRTRLQVGWLTVLLVVLGFAFVVFLLLWISRLLR